MIVLNGLGAKVDHIAFADDGRAILATSWANPTATAVWRLPEGGRPTRFGGFAGVGFAPGGESIIGVTSNVRHVTEVIGRMPLRPSPAEFIVGTPAPKYLGNLSCLQLSPDHSRLVASKLGHELLWWSWPSFEPLGTWALELCGEQGIADLTFTPDGSAVAVLQHDGLTLHDTVTGQIRWTAEMQANASFGCVAWSPAGRLVTAAAGKRLRVFDASDGSRITELTQPSKHYLDAKFTRDGRFLATVSHEETVKFFDVRSWGVQTELAWEVGGLRAITFSLDGMLAAVGGKGKKVVVWDLDP
jgi:WD40 repeat protein